MIGLKSYTGHFVIFVCKDGLKASFSQSFSHTPCTCK